MELVKKIGDGGIVFLRLCIAKCGIEDGSYRIMSA